MAVDVRIITQITGDAKIKSALNGITGATEKLRNKNKQTNNEGKKQTEQTLDIFKRLKNAIKTTVPELDVLVKGFVAFKAAQAALGGVARTIGAIIRETSDAQETTGKFNAVFKDLSGAVREWINIQSEAMGRSRIDFENYSATLQDTFVPMGFARDQAAEMSKRLTVLAFDLAAFHNVAESEVVRNLASAMRGNSEAVGSYGVDLTQTTLKQEIANQATAGLTFETERQAKASARLALILKDTADAHGAAIREAEGYAGQLRELDAATRDLMVDMGESGLLQIATKVVGALTSLARASSSVINTMREFAGDPIEAAKSLGDSIEDFIIQKFIKWGENALVLNEAMSSLFKGEFLAAIDILRDFNKEVEVGVNALEETAKVAEDAADAVSDFTEETKRSENAIDDATRATIEHHRRLNQGLGILRQQKDAEREAAEAARQRARETRAASKTVVETMSDEARQRCGFEKKIDECGNETWVRARGRSQTLTKELIRNAEGVKIFACKVAKEQEVCVTENQIIIEREVKKSNERIKKSWEDMLGDIITSTDDWQDQILSIISQTVGEIIGAIGSGINVGLNFNLSISGAGGSAEEEEVAALLGEALGGAFGEFFFGPIGGLVGGEIGAFLGEGFDDFVDVLSNVGESLLDALGDVGDFIGDALGGIGDFLGFQRGGDFIASRPTLIGVGEAGAERVRITPLGAHGGGGGGATIVLQGPTIMDEIGMRRFTRNIERQLSRRVSRGV